MNAVLVTATDTGADTTFVLAVQVLRLFAMLLSAPLVARLLQPADVTTTGQSSAGRVSVRVKLR